MNDDDNNNNNNNDRGQSDLKEGRVSLGLVSSSWSAALEGDVQACLWCPLLLNIDIPNLLICVH